MISAANMATDVHELDGPVHISQDDDFNLTEILLPKSVNQK